MRHVPLTRLNVPLTRFPRLRAGTFIEAISKFPGGAYEAEFPRLRAGTFIEAPLIGLVMGLAYRFPRLRAGTFIEASQAMRESPAWDRNFPAFGRGLSLRLSCHGVPSMHEAISPPSGGDFH